MLPRFGLQQNTLQMPRHFPALPVFAQFQRGQQRVELVGVRGQQFALTASDPRLPELAHVVIDAGQHQGVPDADNVKQCAAETCFAPGHPPSPRLRRTGAGNRKAKQSRFESLVFRCVPIPG